MSAFFELYDTLPREGPGDRESLDWALGVVQPAPNALVLDAGCGSGADIPGLLDHVPQGRVVAIDLHQPYIDRIRVRHSGDARVRAEVADMTDPPGGPFDLIWSAGAIYFLGVSAGLRAWRRHLASGARVAFSQVAWAVARPSAEAQAFWHREYPEMTDRDGVQAQVTEAGFRVLAHRWLPQPAWETYYGPMDVPTRELRSGARPELVEVLDEAEREIGRWRAHGQDYGYLQVVAEPE